MVAAPICNIKSFTTLKEALFNRRGASHCRSQSCMWLGMIGCKWLGIIGCKWLGMIGCKWLGMIGCKWLGMIGCKWLGMIGCKFMHIPEWLLQLEVTILQ